jgi:hypothetical protein
MPTVTVKEEVVEQIDHLTSSTNLEEVVEQALRMYLEEIGLKKMRHETVAFQQMLPDLLNQYDGEYVAVHQGEVIDHDVDLRALHLRVFEALGHAAVLLKKVAAQPEQDLVFRSPRLG